MKHVHKANCCVLSITFGINSIQAIVIIFISGKRNQKPKKPWR